MEEDELKVMVERGRLLRELIKYARKQQRQFRKDLSEYVASSPAP